MNTANTVLVAVGVGVTAVIAYIVYNKYYGKVEVAGIPVNLNQVASQAKLGVFGVGVVAPRVTL